jgi:hypothetical protein
MSMADEGAAPVAAHNFFNRRFMRKYLKTVFPAGFASSLNTDAAGQQPWEHRKGKSPPKPSAAAAASPSIMPYEGGGIAHNKESFMAWARGESTLRVDLMMTDDVAEFGEHKDALDPFTDVAGPYFHEMVRRPATDGGARSETGFTDTLQSITSYVPLAVQPPSNNYVKELLTKELQLSIRGQHKSSMKKKGLLSDRVFVPPSALPVLVPTTRVQVSLYEKTLQQSMNSSYASASTVATSPLGAAGSRGRDVSAPRSQVSHGAHRPQLGYEEWIKEQKALTGKSTLSAALAADNDADKDHAEDLRSESSVVIKMNLAGGGVGAVVQMISPATAAKGVKAAKQHQQRIKLSLDRPRPTLLAPPGGLDEESSLISEYFAASYEPLNLHVKRSRTVEIHYFCDLMVSTSVYQHPARLETLEVGFTLRQLVDLLHSMPLNSRSDAAAAGASGGDSAHNNNTQGGFRFKRAQDPMVFYYRPAFNDWRPVRNATDWDQAKSTHLLSHPAAAGAAGAQRSDDRLKLMFTRNFESDLDDVYKVSKMGSDSTLLSGPNAASVRTADKVGHLSSSSSSLTAAESSNSEAATAAAPAGECSTNSTSTGKAVNAARYHTSHLVGPEAEDAVDCEGDRAEGGAMASFLTPRVHEPAPPSHKQIHQLSPDGDHKQQQLDLSSPEKHPRPPSQGIVQRGAEAKVASTVTMASLTNAVAGAANRIRVTTSQSRSYTSGSVANIGPPLGFPVNPPPHGKESAREKQSQGQHKTRDRGGPLQVLPMPTLAKQEAMAKFLEQELLKTRF